MITVVIPSFNRRDCVLRLLTDVYRQDHPEFEVVVVDDASSDGTAAAIAREFPATRVLVNATNSGPAVTRNRGIENARGGIIVGLDSDVTVPDPSLLSKVEATMEAHPEASLLAFRILRGDGETDDLPRWWHPVPVDRYAGEFFYTSYFSGTAYAVRHADALKAGLFPGWFFMHYEEVELAFRLMDDGGSLLHCPHLRVLHHEAPASGRSRVQLFFKPRNQILLTFSCFGGLHGARYLLPRLAYQCYKAVRHRHLSDYVRAVSEGFRAGIGNPEARRPLARPTLRRIRHLRHGVRPERPEPTLR
jgi:GT2 family glycosyltransferase